MLKMSLLDFIVNILFPPSCAVCGSAVKASGSVCEECLMKFRREMFFRCPKCGGTADKCQCVALGERSSGRITQIGGKSVLSLTFYLNSYKRDEGRVTERMIFALKESGALFDFFAELTADALKRLYDSAGEDISEWILTYPPRSVSKLIDVGYDQCGEVVKRAADLLGMEWAETLKREGGAEQKRLDSTGRAQNADKTLLLIRENVKTGGKYILFDDILTTGSTIAAAERSLYFGGAAEVFPITIAKNL